MRSALAQRECVSEAWRASPPSAHFRKWDSSFRRNALEEVVVSARTIPYKPHSKASWRSGHAEDCKSLHPGSIPGEASKKSIYEIRDLRACPARQFVQHGPCRGITANPLIFLTIPFGAETSLLHGRGRLFSHRSRLSDRRTEAQDHCSCQFPLIRRLFQVAGVQARTLLGSFRLRPAFDL